MEKLSKYFTVTYDKEQADSLELIRKVIDSKWISDNTIIVNCSPDYSSRLTQLINHKLSYLNKNELFEIIDMELPYPTMVQVWDKDDKEYKLYIKYLASWIQKHLRRSNNYLFVDSATCRGHNFAKVKAMINGRIDDDQVRFASLYLQSDSIFKPDFVVEVFDRSTQGGLLFEWENSNNPNWDY